MSEPDPLADTDIYASANPQEEEQKQPTVNLEEQELDDELGDVLNKSFTTERNKSSLVSNIPVILQKKKDDNYAKLFNGITVQDVSKMEQ